MTRAFIVIKDDNKTVAKFYKNADGYPSAIQKLLKDPHNLDWMNPNLLAMTFLQDGCGILAHSDTIDSVDYVDYFYEITNTKIKMLCRQVASLSFTGKPEEFLKRDFNGEWCEGMECDS